MWQTYRHRIDETVEFEARLDPEDDAFYEVRPVRTDGRESTSSVASWRVVKETFSNIYKRKE